LTNDLTGVLADTTSASIYQILMSLAPGTRLGPYEILAAIGAGGMGEVYRARDTRLSRDVAIKVLPLSSRDDQPARSRLLDEARSASQLNHPHICTIYEVGEENGVAFIVMEYVAGRSLSAIISSEGLPTEQVVHYGTQIADALAHAHQRRVVHRDLKPLNVTVTPEGSAKVLDFGLATTLHVEEMETATRSRATLSGYEPLAGTLPYMAPEQLRGEAADARSDIWALGVLLYEIASGHRPFSGHSGFELTSAILRDSPAPLPGHVSTRLATVIRKCLVKDPAARYQRAGEVRSALETLGSPGTSMSAPVEAPAAGSPRALLSTWAVLGSAALLAVLFTLNTGGLRERLFQRSTGPAIHSLAVLPLSNLSADPSQEFFADGMTAELIREISKIAQLRVVSRTSVMSYKGTHTPIPQIARELKVNALLEGSVARSGNHVRITVGLYEGAADRELWSQTFERDLHDILTLEDEVARAIAVQIRLTVSSAPGTRRASTNPEAYDLYLKGRYSLDQGSPDALKLGLVYFRQGIEKDPQYAPLYAGLADSVARLPFYTDTRPNEAFPEAKDAAAKALQLDPSLAEAHASMAYVLNYYDWDRAGAEQEFKHALDLGPNDAAAHEAFGRFLASMGRLAEARAELNRAQELDPLSLVIQSNAGMIAYFATEYDDALQQLRKVLELDPKFPVPYWGIGMCYEQQKKYPEALAQFEKGIELSGRGANGLASLAHAYGVAGQHTEARRILIELQDRSKTRYVSSYQFAVIYLGLGQDRQAMAALEDAYHERSTLLGYLKMDPRFDPLRSDPRFQDLLSRIRLPK
jgi:serine/threonine protein kinase/tetratricopeptide (TPR) repeat protein